MERTLVLIKPDGVKRALIGEILSRYEKKGLKIADIRMFTPSRELSEKHYEEHNGKTFYAELIDYITSGPVVACIVEGENAVKCVRLVNGATRYQEALPGTIRGDFANMDTYNLVHSSDSVSSAEREIGLWFS